jgi:uncharacterized protein YfiM (DUF2279 family)
MVLMYLCVMHWNYTSINTATRHFILVLVCNLIFSASFFAQNTTPRLLSLTPADSIHKGRLWLTTVGGVAGYSGAMVGLYQAWYSDYPLTRFHTFNDNKEWMQMDKMGHWLMSYHESRWAAMGANWVGFSDRKSAWIGFASGQLIQTSFEIFDGFSDEWGWSWGDIGFNTLGSGMFLAQQLGWREQRIVMKMSARPVRYPSDRLYPITPVDGTEYTTLKDRADELYGTGPVNLFLKNYNTLAVWASVNPRSFMNDKDNHWWPRWLNVAVGMGADNMFAGFDYEWQKDKSCTGPDCVTYRVDAVQYPRTRQMFLSLDLDLSRIPVRNRFLRTLLSTANIFKIPAPTLEWRSGGKWKGHWIYF